MIRILLAALFGVLEGVSEWLPVSSTGHLILLRYFVAFPVRDEFFELFEVVIQLGAIAAVVVLYFNTLNPFCRGKSASEKRNTWRLLSMVALATLPSALVGALLDDWLDVHLYRPEVVAVTLLAYGVIFLFAGRRSAAGTIDRTDGIGARHALSVGAAQLLALVPGTSRSGATMLGGVWSGLSRTAAAEFSFFLGIPTMLGASLFKAVKLFCQGVVLTQEEWLMLASGTLCAFLVSLVTIRTLLSFVRRRSFLPFGIYRILLGGVLLAVFIIKR